MYRQIIGYVPSNVIPALVSIAMVVVYTRLLSPAAFGVYNFIFSAILVLQTSFFYALPVAVMRFYPAAARDGRQYGMLKEAYIVFYTLCIVLGLLGIGTGLIVTFPVDYRLAAWLALPVLVFRSVVQLNQSVNRSANLMRRHNAVESLHAILGLTLSLGAIYLVGRDAGSIMLGLLAAAVVCALPDIRLFVSPFRRRAGALDITQLIRLVEYGWPLVAVAVTSVILQSGDRFLIGSMAGASVLGIYAVAYSLVERPTSLICSSISTATFPLAVQVLENQGREAARLQASRNGIALLAALLPACVGLALTADQIATTVVGIDFRLGVAGLIPIMSLTALARGLRSHFIDHAFHLSGKPLMMLWTYGPATVVNIGLNIYLVPRYGITGAAYSGLVCQCLTVLGGWFLGKSLFPIWMPVGQVINCILAVLPMAALLLLVQFPGNWMGLLAAISLGGLLYVTSAIILDVGGIRSIVTLTRRARIRDKVPAMTD